ncbi:tyrosine-type recombinase/integrase [Niveibacterium sp.]|uniref:tyrosine-type recombinase/integrase n=1 Tax=Niveibacterium sp. TaxID=2017444 RepID=UPI0035B316BC
MPLTDIEIRNAKAAEKPYRLTDGEGLYLEVSPAGGKLWRWKYRFGGKEKRLALGAYPEVRAPEARERATMARKALKEGKDPGAEKKAEKERRKVSTETSFEAISRAWHKKTSSALTATTSAKILRFLERDAFPYLGAKPVSDITAADIVALVRRIESRGAVDIAKRVHNNCGRIFRFAVAHGLMTRDPSRDVDLRDVMAPIKVKHHASIKNPKEVGDLLRAIDGYTGSLVSRTALKVASLTFVRPGELRHAEWAEFDMDRAEWRIPAHKMKMREQHIVPLSEQAIAALREVQPLTGAGRFVFPSERTAQRPMSENTINAALRRMGYTSDEMTGHGFRSMASTLLHELGWLNDAIEAQLAHGKRNQVVAAYNFAKHLPERRRMMQAWADYLDQLKAGAEVIPLNGQVA